MNSHDTARLPPAYWRLWAASAISNLGDGVLIVALPLLVGAAMGAIALLTLSSSITPSTVAKMARAHQQSLLDDTPTAIDADSW